MHYIPVILLLLVRRAFSDDCYYKTTANQSECTQDSCLTGNKTLIRSIECSVRMGKYFKYTAHLPVRVRPDIQRSRQRWLRAIILLLTKLKVSKDCIKRILCEQLCKDSLNGQVASDYPQIMPYDNKDNREYVHAFLRGESHSCYKTSIDKMEYNEISCDRDCHRDYSQCDSDMQNSLISLIAHKIGRAAHLSGMRLFRSYWVIRDRFDLDLILRNLKQTMVTTIQRIGDIKRNLRPRGTN